MKIICDTTEFQMEQKSAVAIGKFDGVHRGHMELLSHIIQMKKKKMAAVVFTFHPSAAVFFGQSKEAELTTRYEKRQLFESMGVDVLVEFPLNKETAATSPEEFVEKILARQMQAGYIAAGADVSFGYKGLGNKELLIRMAGQLDYQVEIINKVYEEAREISSTYVREEVEKGDMEKTARLLGRFYSFEGQVERGNRLGRKLGMPTLNLYPEREKLLPPKGVYYSRVLFEGGTYPGITNIGLKPTVNSTSHISVETYLYDFDKDMYGRKIVTELLQFKRPEQKFESVEMLKTQMEKDIAQGRMFHLKKTCS
ncbi:MAG: bifunctional riboflavin kinase/FAD synthetase [Lachnospiraceae bacterium]|jgi:riboflavin kinase/FMN adenylyltransferase|nr:riboflavin biosynthesis protein RibF [Lachnospiraceae bacterium 10-1]MCX4350936.1 bifunctional riboflavin kinase/FAD synthetase [Lachnospiraceae bacterium]